MSGQNDAASGGYRDALLWIGKSYRNILCHKEPPEHDDYCYLLGPRSKKVRCFVHEAESRGCCRKVPYFPEWIEPGKSRIFLAHSDSDVHEEPWKASIFSFFLVARFEVITQEAVYRDFKMKHLPWSQALARDITYDVLRKLPERSVKPEEVKQAVEMAFKKRADLQRKGEARRDSVTRRLGEGRATRPPQEGKKARDDSELPVDEILETIEDYLEDQIKAWIDSEGNHVFGGESAQEAGYGVDGEYSFVPLSISALEPHRFCSKRLKVGARYLVDGLTAAITDSFMKKLDGGKGYSYAAGEDSFRNTVKTLASRTYLKDESIPPCLRPVLEDVKEDPRRGALCLFPRPYPILERRPEAAFRGLLRINGDSLIEAICQSYQAKTGPCTPTIDFWVPERERKYVDYAKREGFTKETARTIVETSQLLVELKEGEKVVFDGVGSLRRTSSGFSFKP